MSKVRKAKKYREPNVPLEVGPRAPAIPAAESRMTAPSATPEFDYTYTRKDLSRIAVLAGVIFAVLVGLSFVLR